MKEGHVLRRGEKIEKKKGEGPHTFETNAEKQGMKQQKNAFHSRIRTTKRSFPANWIRVSIKNHRNSITGHSHPPRIGKKQGKGEGREEDRKGKKISGKGMERGRVSRKTSKNKIKTKKSKKGNLSF